MVCKVLALIAVVALPFSLVFWHRSHVHPEHYRCDLTAHRSLWVYLRHGTCGLHLLSMPTPTAYRGEFRGVLKYDPPPITRYFMLRSQQLGPYRATWFVFPLWVVSGTLGIVAGIPVVRGPLRQWWRKLHGWCLECGYDLRGNRSGRCPECGVRFR